MDDFLLIYTNSLEMLCHGLIKKEQESQPNEKLTSTANATIIRTGQKFLRCVTLSQQINIFIFFSLPPIRPLSFFFSLRISVIAVPLLVVSCLIQASAEAYNGAYTSSVYSSAAAQSQSRREGRGND